MDCPKCETPSLETSVVRGIEVDRCSHCQGIWFDDKELSGLVGLSRKDLRSLDSGRPDEAFNLKHGQCPRDGTDLLRVYSPQDREVVLDACATCNGIWLDAGEMSKLLSNS